MGASMRYLSQRYAMPYDVGKAVLTDIGTEELAHLEIVAAIVHILLQYVHPVVPVLLPASLQAVAHVPVTPVVVAVVPVVPVAAVVPEDGKYKYVLI